MKKVNSVVGEKKGDQRAKKIKFNLTPTNLECFKGKGRAEGQKKVRLEGKKDKSNQMKNQLKMPMSSCMLVRQKPKQERPRSNSHITEGTFNEWLVFIQYDQFDSCVGGVAESHSFESDISDDEIVSSCVRVITEETDITSQPLTHYTPTTITPSLTPRCNMQFYNMAEYYPQPQYFQTMRNKRSVTMEQSKAFIIDFYQIQEDGRTTIMIKNIPNKYTQDTLLAQFSINHQNKFDFFYLPIDKDNQCNVGYAFVNFIKTEYIGPFYEEFHHKKWKKYNSAKICNLCYARYQGTQQLANHFRHTKILQQKDRKLRPLIGDALKDIEKIVQHQRSKE